MGREIDTGDVLGDGPGAGGTDLGQNGDHSRSDGRTPHRRSERRVRDQTGRFRGKESGTAKGPGLGEDPIEEVSILPGSPQATFPKLTFGLHGVPGEAPSESDGQNREVFGEVSNPIVSGVGEPSERPFEETAITSGPNTPEVTNSRNDLQERAGIDEIQQHPEGRGIRERPEVVTDERGEGGDLKQQDVSFIAGAPGQGILYREGEVTIIGDGEHIVASRHGLDEDSRPPLIDDRGKILPFHQGQEVASTQGMPKELIIQDPGDYINRLEQLSQILVDPVSAIRYVVKLEEQRVQRLFAGEPVVPQSYEGAIKGAIHTLLTKAGLYPSHEPVTAWQPVPDEIQESAKLEIKSELEHTRELLRSNIDVTGLEALAVDNYLHMGLRDCLLPPMISEFHHHSEEMEGREIRFLEWMTVYATDEQLLSVWQWHDNYLREHDLDPAFVEKVEAVKTSYSQGKSEGIRRGILHPSIAAQDSKDSQVRIVHGSPFSPNLALAHAVTHTNKLIEVRPDTREFIYFHELSHTDVRLAGIVDEGTADRTAMLIYNLSHPVTDQVGRQEMSYPEQFDLFNSLNKLTGGSLNLYEITRLASGDNKVVNTLAFKDFIDTAVGLPIFGELISDYYAALAITRQRYNSREASGIAREILYREARFLEAMLLDDKGDRIPQSLYDLARRIDSPETRAAHERYLIDFGRRVVKLAGAKILADGPQY